MNYNMQGYAPYAGAYSSMYNTNAQVGMQNAQNPWMGVLGQFAGGIGTGIGTGVGGAFGKKFF